MSEQKNVHSLEKVAQMLGTSRSAVLSAAARAGIIGTTSDSPELVVYFNDDELALIHEKISQR